MQTGKLRRTEKEPSKTWASEDQGETLFKSFVTTDKASVIALPTTSHPTSAQGREDSGQEGGMHAGLKTNFSSCMPVVWNGPSPGTVIHSLSYRGSVSIPCSSVQSFSSKGIAGPAPPPSHPSTHTIVIYTLVSLGRPYEMLARGSVSDNLGLIEIAEEKGEEKAED